MTKLKVTPEDNPTSQSLKAGGEKNVANLKTLKGAAFDKAYVDHEVAYHQQVLDAVDKTLIPEREERGAEGAARQGPPGVRRAPRAREAPTGVARQGEVSAGRAAIALGLLLVQSRVGAAAPPRAAASTAARPKTHTVTIAGMVYKPALVVASPGDTVVWVNEDLVPHSATAPKAGGFDSDSIAGGKSWSHTFRTKGDLTYICKFHPTMRGVVSVK